MPNRLSVYNGALDKIGERPLDTLSQNVEARRALDRAWNDNAVKYCLEQGQWIFAMRVSKFTYDANATALFGFTRAFQKPEDWIATSAVCQDEDFSTPLTFYEDSDGWWFSYLDHLYIKYVSNDTDYGQNLSLWPESFTQYVETYLADKVCLRLTSNASAKALLQDPNNQNKGYLPQARLTALNKDAMAKPTSFPARGRWARARLVNGGGTNDQGNRGQLIG